MIEIFIAVVIPWIITICFCLMILATAIFIPRLARGFWRLHWIIKLLLLATLIIGTYLRIYHVPNTHRIYYDEDRYLSYAVTFARYDEAKSIKYANDNQLIGDPDQAVRLTVPVLNAWVFRLWNYGEYYTHIAAKVFSVMQILLIFIFTLLFFRSPIAAIFASIGMSLLPNVVYWSPSTTLDPYFVFFGLITSIAAYLYAIKPTLTHKLFFASTLFALLCVRLEAFLFIPILWSIIYFERKNLNTKFISYKELHFYIFLLWLIGIRALASISVLGQKWCCAEGLPIESFYPAYFIRNLLPNIVDLFFRIEFPGLISAMALITLIQNKDKKVFTLGIWFFAYFILYSFYYAGMLYSNEFSGSYGRYFLILNPPLLILAGLFFEQIIRIVNKYSISAQIIVAATSIFVMSLVLKPLYSNYSRLISKSPYHNTVEAGPAYIHDFTDNYLIPNTPPNSLVLSTIASSALIAGRSSSLFGLFADDAEIQKLVLNELKNKKRVFSSLAIQCNDKAQNCDKLNSIVEFVPVLTKKDHPDGLQFVEIKLKNKSK